MYFGKVSKKRDRGECFEILRFCEYEGVLMSNLDPVGTICVRYSSLDPVSATLLWGCKENGDFAILCF